MKEIDVYGPIGIAIRKNEVCFYFKNKEPLLVKEEFKKRIRVFVDPEKKEEILEKIRKLGDFEDLLVIDDVIYNMMNPKKASLISFYFEGKRREMEELKLKLNSIQGIIGIEDRVSDSRKQEHFLSKLEKEVFSKKIGYYLKTRLCYEECGKDRKLIKFSQDFPENRKDVIKQLKELEKELVLFTVDYETSNGKIVIATVKSSDGFSKTLVVNENQKLLDDFKKVLKPYGIDIEIVPDEKTLIRKIYEYRKKADIEIIHGSSILEKHKDREAFPSIKERPTDKFDIRVYYRFIPTIQIVTSEGIIPSEDSLYTCKFLHPEIRSLEDMLEFFLGDKKTLKKTDYKNFEIYNKIRDSLDVHNFKEEIVETIIHNSQDAEAHLKLSKFLLFDLGFLALPILYSIDIKNVFSKVMEDIGEAILNSEFVQNKIFPKITKSYTSLKKEKERIIRAYEKIFTKNYGERIEGKWVYPFVGFAPKVILENQEFFGPYISSVFEKMIKFKEEIEVYGVDEDGKNIIFDPYSFSINCVSACLYFGKKTYTDENISDKLLKIFSEIYKNLNREFDGCKVIYSSPFKSRMFISEIQGNFSKDLNEKYKTLLAGYNKHTDVFIPLDKKHALATESGRIIKIGWRGASKSDPIVVRKAEEKIIEDFVKYGLNKAFLTFKEELKKIENLEYPREHYKISGKLSKKPEEYRKKIFKLEIIKKAYEEYRKIYQKYPAGFIDFYVIEGEKIDFSENSGTKIEGRFYGEYLRERLKPLLPFFKTEISEKNNRLTYYMK
ncbi:MAG: hypothetical protein QXR09_01075 [Candidatus Aenigmatarchaeota archaeon]